MPQIHFWVEETKKPEKRGPRGETQGQLAGTPPREPWNRGTRGRMRHGRRTIILSYCGKK